MEYVIKSERLRKYLYALGFNYRQVTDKTGKQAFIYLFEDTDDLKEAITFYTELKKRLKYKIA